MIRKRNAWMVGLLGMMFILTGEIPPVTTFLLCLALSLKLLCIVGMCFMITDKKK